MHKPPIANEEIESLLLDGYSQRYIRSNYSVGKNRVSRIAKDLNEDECEDAEHVVEFENEGADGSKPSDLARPFFVKRQTTQYTHGEVSNYWVTEEASTDKKLQRLDDVFEAFKSHVPKQPPRPAPTASTNDKLLNAYIISDYHFGAFSDVLETGDAWNIDVAYDLLIKWFSSVINDSPNAETGLFVTLGDYLHFDSILPVTPTHGNVLDASGRFHSLVDVAIEATIDVINMLLYKHKYVHIINAEGNHDIASSYWLRGFLAKMYEDEPRVTVEKSPDPYYAYEFGNTALFFHHGHLTKANDLPTVFASKFREIFGRTTYAYGHCGHLHHHMTNENPIVEITRHPTLAGADSHASRNGYMSKRSAFQITYHRDFGEVGAIRRPPEAVL